MASITITQSDNTSNSNSFEGTLKDEFLPIVNFKFSDYEEEGDDLGLAKNEKGEEEKAELSKYLDSGIRSQQIILLTTTRKKIKLPFTVEKGGDASWDDDGIIETKLSIDDPEVKLLSKPEIKTKYGSEIKVEVELTGKESKEFYIKFYARDNEDDFWNTGELKDVYCGCVKVVFKVERKGIYPVEITVEDKIIGEGILHPYPNDNGNIYKTPLYNMKVSGTDDDNEEKIYSFKVIRFGIERDLKKGITEPRVVGLAEQQEYILNWDQFTMNGEGSWRVFGNFLVHRGASNPATRDWGAIGCIEVCGLNEWDRFNKVIEELSNSTSKVEISEAKKLKIIYQATARPKLILK